MLRLVIILLLLANAGYFAWTQGYLGPLGLMPVDSAEPERLQAQIKPEALRLLNGPKGQSAPEPAPEPAPAPAPVPAPEVTTAAPADAAGSTTPAAASAAAPSDSTVQATVTAVPEPPPPAPEPPAPVARTACWLASGFSTEQADTLRNALSGSGLPRQSWQLNESRVGGRWVIFMGRYSDEQLDKKRGELKELGVAFRTLPPPLGPGLALGTFSSEAAANHGLDDLGKKGVRTARVVAEREGGASTWTLRLPAATDAQRDTVRGLGAALAGKRLQACPT